MGELKPKKPVRRRVMKAANSPEPTGPVGGSMPDEPTEPQCGHMSCTGAQCGVRYVGPTSHMRDHHIVHAARGITHIWSAAIITGLAIVLTGAIAFSSVQAASTPGAAASQSEVSALAKRLDRIEKMLKDMSDRCVTQAKECRGTTPTDGTNTTAPAPVSCATCAEKLTKCLTTAGEDRTKQAACKQTDALCQSTCKK